MACCRGAFGFYGPGPETNITSGSIFLGLLNRIVINGVKSGTPDHLHVFFDETITRTDLCGQREKHIDFSVVDAGGRRTGRVAINEAPHPGLRDSCNNALVSLTTECDDTIVNAGGNFRDRIRTGCPTVGGHCGFEFYNYWQWCVPTDGSICKRLASIFYAVHYDVIKIDNEATITLRDKF